MGRLERDEKRKQFFARSRRHWVKFEVSNFFEMCLVGIVKSPTHMILIKYASCKPNFYATLQQLEYRVTMVVW